MMSVSISMARARRSRAPAPAMRSGVSTFLQTLAQGASGQMQAIGYANQLVSQQSNQLLQIRGLLIAQQNAMVTKMQAEADLEAKQQAAGATSR